MVVVGRDSTMRHYRAKGVFEVSEVLMSFSAGELSRPKTPLQHAKSFCFCKEQTTALAAPAGHLCPLRHSWALTH